MELEEILKQTIDNLKQVTDTESVVGKPVVSADGTVILPVVKLSAGYVVGAGGHSGEKLDTQQVNAGVGGGGVSICPVGFLLVGREKRFISVNKTTDSKLSEFIKTAVNTFKQEDEDQ
jgi:uncharacterized spore protein YtfJ